MKDIDIYARDINVKKRKGWEIILRIFICEMKKLMLMKTDR